MYTQHPYKIITRFDSYQNELLSCMGVEYTQPAHLLDRYIKGGDINGIFYGIDCAVPGALVLMKSMILPLSFKNISLIAK